MPRATIRFLPTALVFAALYIAAVCTPVGQSSEETVFLAWRHAELRGGPEVLRLVGQVESVVGLIPAAAAIVAVTTVVVVAVRRQSWRSTVPAVVVGGSAAVATELLKLLLPHPALVASDFAAPTAHTLPSGHVTIVAATVLVVSMLVPRRFRSAVIAAGAPLVAAVGIALVGIGWHRTSDVLAGVVVVITAAVVARRWPTPDVSAVPLRSRRGDGHHPGVVVSLVLSVGMLVVAAIAAVWFGPVAGGVSGMQPAPPADLVVPAALIAAVSGALATVLLWPSAPAPARRARRRR